MYTHKIVMDQNFIQLYSQSIKANPLHPRGYNSNSNDAYLGLIWVISLQTCIQQYMCIRQLSIFKNVF